MRDAHIHYHAVAVLRQYVAHVGKLGLRSACLLKQPRQRIGERLMGVVPALLLVPVDRRIVSRIVRRWLQSIVIALFALEALLPSPGFDECAIHAEVFIGKQFLGTCLLDDEREELFSHCAFQQPVPVLREYRGMPHCFIRGQADKPAEQEVVFQLLHQHALTTHRIQQLQKQRAQQPLGRNRLAPIFTVNGIETRTHLLQCQIHHRPDRPQRVIPWHPLF